ncbi:cation diffusion facilitator family transporter [Alkalispirillum mobile]|uniref:Cation diffusion facilitator family transporter n=1 Tax=Alkalispirillum mobile TaxID=85925 RepID=A0A498C808_9GAMM|nr:cation diffusion facilitator family transporter [Alkalispirillum mobile]RLK48708.1 cation diffusion facilitator family transporter [Alkalispirillum mobile]
MSAESLLNGDDYQAKRRVTLVGSLVNVLLAIGKIIAGVIGHSQALIVDGVHSLSDLVSDALVLWAARVGSYGADLDHPYGHARIETAATVGVGALLLLVAGGFTYDAAIRMMNPEDLLTPGWIALAAAVFSVLAKEGLYHYTKRVARVVRSDLIHANAWHHRSDALSSVVVIIGVAGAMAGVPWLDALAALVVALMIGAVGWRLAWHSARELVDTGLDPDELAYIGRIIDSVDGVEGHDDLRTRRMGSDTLVDVHIRVAQDISVSEGHRISDAVLYRLCREVDHVAEVLVHVDHEGLPEARRSAKLPLRRRAEAELRSAWGQLLDDYPHNRAILHYRDGHLDVDLIITGLDDAPQAGRLPALQQQLQERAEHIPYVGRIRLLAHLGS